MILPRFPRLRSLSPSQRAHGEDLALFTAVAAAVVGPWVGRGWLLLLDWTAGPRTTVTPGVYGLDANQADAMPARLGFVILRTLVGAQAAAWVPVALAIVLGGVGRGPVGRVLRADDRRAGGGAVRGPARTGGDPRAVGG